MTRTLTWIGGGSNLASNRYDWSPQHRPHHGDTLLMDHGTMAVVDDALRGAPLYRVVGSASADATIYMDGAAAMHLVDQGRGYGATIVNIDYLSTWTGDFATGPFGGGLTIQGPGTFENTGASLIDNNVLIDTPITGTGSLTIDAVYFRNALLEVTRDVAATQSVSIGGRFSADIGTLKVDDPLAYHAATTLSFGEIILNGLDGTCI